MPIIKQKTGRLDEEDIFLTGSLTDFLGGGVCSRKDGKFILKKGEIKRNFPYEEFSVVVKNENAIGSETGKRICFVETTLRKLGICESASVAATWYRITMSDGFVQAFISADGEVWENTGGSSLEKDEKVLFMGFKIDVEEGNTDVLEFSSCKAYISPFVKVLNFPENFTMKLLDEEGNTVKTEPFGRDMIARTVLDANITGSFEINNLAGGLVYKGENLTLEVGDEYLNTRYSLELWQGDTLLEYGPTTLGESKIQLLRIKNAEGEDCTDLKLTVGGRDADKVLFSLDGTEYTDVCLIGALAVGEDKSFYIKVDGEAQKEFTVYDFEIVVL